MKKILGALLVIICLLSTVVFVSAEENICVTYDANEITYFSAKLNGNIVSNPETISEYGFTIYENGGQAKNVVLGSSRDSSGEFSHTVLVLANTKYFYKTYAKTTENQIVYGELVSFTTKARPQHQMPVIDFNAQVQNPTDIDITKNPNMFYLNNLIVNQKDKLQLIAGQNFYGQNLIASAGDDPILLNQFFMNNYNENIALNTLLTIFDAMYNFEEYAFDIATTTLVVPDAVAELCNKDELSTLIYELCGDMEYKRYAGALNEAIKCDYTSSDKRTFSFEQGNYIQQSAIVDVINKSKQLIETPEEVYNSLAGAADDYVNKVLPSYILSGSQALEMAKYVSTEAADLTSEQKSIYVKYISNYLKDYRKYSNWNFSDAELETLQNSFESEFYSPKASALANVLGFALEATANTVSSNSTTEQLIRNKDLLKDLFLRLKKETDSPELSAILGDYAQTTEHSVNDNFYDTFSNISTAFINNAVKSPVADLVEDKVSVSIMNAATAANSGAALATAKKLATLNYAKLAAETGLFFTEKISGTKTFLEKTIELKYLYNIENASLSMLQKDFNAYISNPTEEAAEKVLKDLTWIKALRLRGITLVNEMYQSNSKSLLGKAGTVLGSTTASAVNAVYTSQKDALIRASLYENGYTLEPLTLNSGETYTIIQSDEYANNGTLNGAAFSYACGRLAGGVVLNGGSTLTITNADVYIPYIIVNGSATINGNIATENITHRNGTLTINGNITTEQFTHEGGTVNVNGELTVNDTYMQKYVYEYQRSYPKLNISGRLIVGDYYADHQCTMSMASNTAYMLVNNDFTVRLSFDYTHTHKNILDKGVIEVKGDFRIEKGDGYMAGTYGYVASGSHKTILSGDKKQTVYFYSSYSHFGILEIRNTSEDGVEFTNAGVTTSIENSSILINSINIKMMNNAVFVDNTWNHDISFYNYTLSQNIVVNGNVKITGSTILDGDIQALQISSVGGTATINGNITTENVTHSDGTLTINGNITTKQFTHEGGTVNVNGELTVNDTYMQKYVYEYQRSYPKLNISGRLIVKDYSNYNCIIYMAPNSYMLANNNFTIRFSSSTAGKNVLTNGVLEVKGDFRIEAEDGYMQSHYGYVASGSHKTILSGNKKQTVYFYSSYSHFGILEIRNTSEDGVEFTNTNIDCLIIQPIYSVLIQKTPIKLQGKPAFVDYGAEVNTAVNKYVGNHESVIPTWLDYQEYSINQEIITTDGIKLSDVSTTATKTSVSGTVKITNNDKDYEDAQFIIAVYSNQELIGVSITDIDSIKGTQTIQNYAVNCWEPIGQAALKVMLWQDLEDLVPLCDFVQTNVSVQ